MEWPRRIDRILAGHRSIIRATDEAKRCFLADALLLHRGNVADDSRCFGLLWASRKRSSNRSLVVGDECSTCRTVGSSVVPQSYAETLHGSACSSATGCAAAWHYRLRFTPHGSWGNVSRTSVDWHRPYLSVMRTSRELSAARTGTLPSSWTTSTAALPHTCAPTGLASCEYAFRGSWPRLSRPFRRLRRCPVHSTDCT